MLITVRFWKLTQRFESSIEFLFAERPAKFLVVTFKLKFQLLLHRSRHILSRGIRQRVCDCIGQRGVAVFGDFERTAKTTVPARNAMKPSHANRPVVAKNRTRPMLTNVAGSREI